MGEMIHIADLTADTDTLSVLKDYCARDDQIDTAILDNNTDGYLDYKRSFLSDLTKEQYIALQKNLQRFGFQARDEENVQEAFETYDELKHNGIDAGTIYSDLDAQVSWFLNSYSWELPDLLKTFGSPESLIKFLKTLASTPPWSNQGYWEIRFALSFAKESGAVLTEQEWPQYLKTVASILPYTGAERRKRAIRAIEHLTIDWRVCTTLFGFGKELARVMNVNATASESDEKWPETLSNISAMICNIYEREKDDDKRTNFISGFASVLADQAFYQLISLNYGGHLMTTVFDILWRPRQVTSVAQWLDKMDPDHHLRGRFLKSVSSLDRVKIFSGEIDFTIDVLFEEFWQQGSEVSEFAIPFTHYLEELLPVSTSQNRQHFANLLWANYQKTGDAKIHKAVSFWIQYYTPKYQLEQYRPELKALRQVLPAVRAPQIPLDTWLQDKTLQARLCFYSDEEYTTQKNDKSDGQNWFEYTQGLLKANGWQFESADFESPLKIFVMQKMVNGISLKMTLTLQMEDANFKPLPDQDGYEIIAHRGHYQTLEKTFPTNSLETLLNPAAPQLLYLGACKSMSFAADDAFQDRYSQDFLVSDLDVSRGETSTQFLIDFMTNVANDRTGWDRYKKYHDVNKLVFPDNPVTLISSYMRGE